MLSALGLGDSVVAVSHECEPATAHAQLRRQAGDGNGWGAAFREIKNRGASLPAARAGRDCRARRILLILDRRDREDDGVPGSNSDFLAH